jgi:uncharacterized protein YbjT (DUF2867 family)/uncharacterized membrane protein
MTQTQAGRTPRAMVLGGYGLIGAACLRALSAAGFEVIGVGRDARAVVQIDVPATWLIRDIARTSAEEWVHDFKDIDVVVNASGALQSGARDSLELIHETAIEQMIAGLAQLPGQNTRFIQISAAGVSSDSSTAFFQTKARGDAHLMQSALDWIVLRPSLVLGRAAYGGTALLRAASAVPFIGLRVLPDTPVQTVALEDLSRAVVQCAKGDIPSRTLVDISAPEVHRFGDLTDRMRRWHGLPPWRAAFALPAPLVNLTSKIADGLGWLGWRFPLRSSALTVLKGGIKADPSAWLAVGGAPCRSLEETLAANPATVQDRWFARLFLLLPLAIATLSLFWLLSGLIGFIRLEQAMETLTSRGISTTFASIAVIGGGIFDILLGAAVLYRRTARAACFGMIALSAGYLSAGTFLTPDIWADPLGPFVKVLPGITLAALTATLLDDR